MGQGTVNSNELQVDVHALVTCLLVEFLYLGSDKPSLTSFFILSLL